MLQGVENFITLAPAKYNKAFETNPYEFDVSYITYLDIKRDYRNFET